MKVSELAKEYPAGTFITIDLVDGEITIWMNENGDRPLLTVEESGEDVKKSYWTLIGTQAHEVIYHEQVLRENGNDLEWDVDSLIIEGTCLD